MAETYAASQLGGVTSAFTPLTMPAPVYAPSPMPPDPPATYKPSPIDIVIHTESGGNNVTQSLGTKDVNNNYGRGGGHPAKGYLQVIDPTYKPYAEKLGIDTSRYRDQHAAREQQIAVASSIPFNQWGGASKRAVAAAYPGIDIRGKTLGQIQAEAGGATPTAGLGSSSAPRTAPATAQSVGNALASLTKSNSEGKSPLGDAQSAFGGQQQQQQQQASQGDLGAQQAAAGGGMQRQAQIAQQAAQLAAALKIQQRAAAVVQLSSTWCDGRFAESGGPATAIRRR